METLLLEKNRISDEAKAHDYALDGIAKEAEIKKQVYGFKQRLQLAKELKAIGQVKLFQKAIGKIERAYRIAHKNPYPEVTKADAMDAMCEPIKPQEPSPVEKVKGTLNENMRNALGRALDAARALEQRDDSGQVYRSINQLAQYQNAMMNNRINAVQSMIGAQFYRAGSGLLGDTVQWNRLATYSRQTHKYDLDAAILNMTDLAVEGSIDSGTMLPMSALCRLKEAKEKNMFDHFEVWRPTEWKAPDPWLVGAWHDEQGSAHHFKVCDWR